MNAKTRSARTRAALTPKDGTVHKFAKPNLALA
jgi:hypothetical protein